ncbi:MAG: PilT/PilU family type 4a pilus ATPase [Armatimonadota bacterium]|nr:MAG: PilT/PilU family type 4a pilus ATPase [Armatimonadota bacterium]
MTETSNQQQPPYLRLAEIVVAAGLVDPETVDQAIERHKASDKWLGGVLIEMGAVKSPQLVTCLARALAVQPVDMASYPIDLATATSVSAERCHKLLALPLSRSDSILYVAMANPVDGDAIARLKEATGCRLEIMVAGERELTEAIERVHAKVAQEQKGIAGVAQDTPTELPEVLHVDELLEILMERRGSDLHQCVGSPPVIRVDGDLEPLKYAELTPTKMQETAYAILTDERIIEFERTHELDFAYSVAGLSRFRVNVHKQRGSVGAVLRAIPMSPPTLEQLKMPPVLKSLTTRPRGLILVTGPTGSGKSTTLAGMINEINSSRRCHIVTIEDPIEFLHRNKKSIIIQREVGADTTSFTAALRHVLRQDPDVILIGEMRDLETIAAAVTAAETGHLVLATLHTTSASQTIDRVIDVFPPHQQEQIRLQLSTVLEGIICQTLLPRTDGIGRACAQEILIATSAIRNLIREGKTHQMSSTLQSGGQAGMQTLDQSLKALVTSKQVNPDVAAAVAHDSEEFKAFLNMR